MRDALVYNHTQQFQTTVTGICICNSLYNYIIVIFIAKSSDSDYLHNQETTTEIAPLLTYLSIHILIVGVNDP